MTRLEVIVTVGLFVFIAWLMWWTGEYCRRLPMSEGPVELRDEAEQYLKNICDELALRDLQELS